MGGVSRKGYDFEESRVLSVLMVLVSLSLVVGFFVAGSVGVREDANSYSLIVRYCGGEWRRIEFGGSVSCSFTVLNANDAPVTLDFFTWGWKPPGACDDVDVSWDYDGCPVLPSEACDVTLTLVSPSIKFADDFLFYIDFVCSKS